MSAAELVDHFFRHEYGRLVATLCRRFGTAHIEVVEDAVQSALLSALASWPQSGVPDNPTAWLFRVAKNALVDELRGQSRRDRILSADAAADATTEPGGDKSELGEDQLQDDLLRLLFACCDESIPVHSQLAFALKTLCGFDVREIARRLFTSEANIYKRVSRARECLRVVPFDVDALTAEQYASRLPAVREVIYLLFTEGYLSSAAEYPIRRELCDEAIRLGTLLAEHPVGDNPETFALVALMHLHAARLSARADSSGGLLLLEEQNRESWDQPQIRTGLRWLARSARGDVYSRYHAEAGIAAEHCLAPTFQDTHWERVAAAYAMLEEIAPAALHRLNRAVAVAEWRGAEAGLQLLKGFEPPTWLSGSYMWSAVLSDLHRRAGHTELAIRHRELALNCAPSVAVRRLLERRLIFH